MTSTGNATMVMIKYAEGDEGNDFLDPHGSGNFSFAGPQPREALSREIIP
jgi:hypothetical protein